MARHARLLSESDIYHIVLKGVNSSTIFYDDKDFNAFLVSFKSTCREYNVEIYAYCLMSNHVHLLLKFNADNMAKMFKSFGAKFVPKYNYLHSRTGPLFNGRFYSSPINRDDYLLSVIRYIHYNPVNAGVCRHPKDYKWSSYNEYKSKEETFADTDYINGFLKDSEFDELHIVDDDALDDFFIQNGRVFGWEYDDLEKFVSDNKDREQTKLIDVLKKCGASKRKISKLLKIDIRKL